jgi:radical SAM protein with 4Fe4S-binding SPASM domain
VSDRFFLCYFETTRRCNLHCHYCMARVRQDSAGAELSTDEAKTLVLDELTKVSSNVAVAFSGGEHLLRPDAYDLLAYAASRGIWSFVNTNGKLLVETDAVPKALQATEGKVIFVLPLNALDSATNRASRDDDAATVLHAADICLKQGAEYFFLVTISRQNLAELDKTVRFLKLTGVPMLRAPFVPRGAGERFRDLLFDAADMQKVIHPALTANPLAYISFTPFFASPEALDAAWGRFHVRIAGLGCQAGRSFAAVGAEGRVAPCVQLLDGECACGDVRQLPLSEIIGRSALFTALRERTGLKGKCGRCRYAQTCGGCRALAYYHSGDVLGEDPTCFFQPAGPESRSDLEEVQTAQVGQFLKFLRYAEPWKSLF